MNIISNKIRYTIYFLFLSIASFAQVPPDPGGGTGGVGTGSPSSPIDMYILILAAVAIAFAVYYSKRYVNQKAN